MRDVLNIEDKYRGNVDIDHMCTMQNNSLAQAGRIPSPVVFGINNNDKLKQEPFALLALVSSLD